ncbi:protein-n(pi)-phosphohistidine--sugar phosphotransferase [Ligilactobacillus acidipiscis DSM 15836]|jgi:PTS system mannitol-specific IIC component|uniref:PTS system mannitol-specific EIICB component n=1 Tax=Ligilactobacillus acidipiscis DSM 15836 TaxID=1423716 RepID=A0ABR5PKW8_9LACO|nr:PTS mannitol transporter subunit IICBA [Ligilactobacillus acidipiscis]KRM27572.1 protein-n(pi)-phosphohistidine--sugar phosphotransferase [Ligilactobacillus acidipiscis DSM 15836]MCI1925249.1 PTS mannitol transporter subunit IICBA [Ligilactobacillus acidipiscis]MCI1954532.1 PTS mannitol transporter subunit IICBA [Ligilactobacillus acidipiscis]GAW64160.1 mannitol-specific PTS system IIBC component [Ligilactobacillus acidipiscis]GEN21285.1 PTS mannitol transporter subunit IICB [Ligilactobacil
MSQDATASSGKPKTSLKAKVQKFGTFLSGMIMPNIAAIIAWGLITAIFLTPGGWFPNATINKLSGPALTYLLPLLIGYTGGKMVDDERGAVVGAIATIGSIVGSNVPMFLGAMIMGPLGGWCMKKFDDLFQDKIKSGFEMIYNNFSAGIMGMLLAILAQAVVGPFVVAGSKFMASGVDWIISVHALPLANLFIEPAKILFLNNAVGNGILVPLGIQQASSAGKSVLFLLESNPGPGIGVLLAFCLFGKGSAKSSAPGAAIIQFFGGIHEIYFPYIMMKPSLFLAVMAGGVTGTFTFQLLGAGLKAAASPGSIISILLMTPKGAYLAVLSGVLTAAIVSFLVAAFILKRDKSTSEDDDFASKQAQVSAMKSESKGNAANTNDTQVSGQGMDYSDVKKVIFACDAGMGSSAMGASLLRDKFKKAGLQDISVTNMAVRNLKDENGLLVVTQEELQERAQQKAPSALSVAVQNFMNSPRYDEIVANLKVAQQGTTDEKENSRPTTNSQSGKQEFGGIDFSQVKEIDFIHHDEHTGSATMATSMLKTQLEKAGKKTTVKRVSIDDVVDDKDRLVISTPETIKNLKTRYTNVQSLSVADLRDQKLSDIVERVQ